MVLLPHRIPGGVAAVLDALPVGMLPRFGYEGAVAGLRRSLRAAVAERLPRPRWLANWLLGDVLHKAALMAELTGSAALKVMLVVEGEEKEGFAISEARLRLVACYRGPGVEWVAPRFASSLPRGAEQPAAALHHLGRGGIAVLRGAAGDSGPGVLHRSAPGRAAAMRLTIDDAPRLRHGAPSSAATAASTLQ